MNSLEISPDNYRTAWDLLKSRYENKLLSIHHLIQALFDLNVVTKESASQLRKLVEDAQKHLRVLKTLGELTDSWDTLIIHMLALRLDSATRRKWELSLQNNDMPKQGEFIEFLTKHFTVLETLQLVKLFCKPALSNPTSNKERLASHVSQTPSKTCVLCQGNHALYGCITFKSLSINERINVVKLHRLCFNCLRPDHQVDKCIAGGCKHCERKHNTLLYMSIKLNQL